MDDCGIVERGGESAAGRIRDERMAHGFGSMFLCLAPVVFHWSLLSRVGRCGDMVLDVAEWGGGLFFRRLVLV